MKHRRLFFHLSVLMCCFFMFSTAKATNESQSSGSTNPLLENLMGIFQESFDDWVGNYNGRLGDVKLLERLGNKVVLEVTYDNVKRSDNVNVQGEVLYYGEKLEGFGNTLNSISGRKGKVTLVIGWAPLEDSDWGTTSEEVQSNQIRLFLVRGSSPDRPFGEIMYDLPKTWTASDAPDQADMTAESDGIELEEEPGPADTAGLSGPSIFVKPGTVLRPKSPAVSSQSGIQSTPQPLRTVQTTQMKPLPVKVQSYDFYSHAKSAKWRSPHGNLTYPGRGNDQRGYVRPVASGKLNSGNKAKTMLLTHPSFSSGGWIEGTFPEMILGNNLFFKSIVGFSIGANQSDGATFQVYVKYNNKYHRVNNTRVRNKKYGKIDVDLSHWANKTVQIVLRIRAGKTSTQDWAVWVKPRLSK